MNKLIVMLLSLVLVINLCACGGTNTLNSESESGLVSEQTSVSEQTPDSEQTSASDSEQTTESEQASVSEKQKFMVTFDADGGEAVASQEVEEGGKVTEPKNYPETKVVKEGNVEYTYTFDGWYNGDDKWDFSSGTVTNSMELKAKWNLTKQELVRQL